MPVAIPATSSFRFTVSRSGTAPGAPTAPAHRRLQSFFKTSAERRPFSSSLGNCATKIVALVGTSASWYFSTANPYLYTGVPAVKLHVLDAWHLFWTELACDAAQNGSGIWF